MPDPRPTEPSLPAEKARVRSRLLFFQPLGFSLRLNLWYTGFFIVGAFLLFGLAYFLLINELIESDREIVRIKLDACREWYTEGGAASLQSHFANESGWEKESTYIRVTSFTQQTMFLKAPEKDRKLLSQFQEMAWIRVTPAGLVLEEIAPGLSVDDVQRATEPKLIVSATIRQMPS